jgi:acylphosphatase
VNLTPSKTYCIIVSGKVQGVGFRNSVYRIATRHGVAGHVRNLHNGTVEIIACADEEIIIEGFLEMVRMVRAPARVDRIESKIVTDFSFPDRSFRIEY